MEFGHLIAASQPVQLPGIAAFFAGSKLARPVVRLFGDPDIRLTTATNASNFYALIKIVSIVKNEYGDPRQQWIGRIVGSNFYPSRWATQSIRERLSAFDLDPIGYVTDQGKIYGQCCMCGKLLTDERSLAAGYGARCAKNWQLPWGDRLTNVSPKDTI